MTSDEWRYLPRGAVKHALRYGERFTAICGLSPVWYANYWLGTGAQVEYETVEQLRACKRCMNLGARL